MSHAIRLSKRYVHTYPYRREDAQKSILHTETALILSPKADAGHFYTYLHAKELGLKVSFTGISYVDYTLVRYRACELRVGEEIANPDLFCGHWELSIARSHVDHLEAV